jgi:hypothetical protein
LSSAACVREECPPPRRHCSHLLQLWVPPPTFTRLRRGTRGTCLEQRLGGLSTGRRVGRLGGGRSGIGECQI